MSSCPTGSGYDPSGAVEAFHGIPHTDIDLEDSPDQFDPESSQYWEAVIIWACVPILACVCIFILMSIYFICVCCCCCCGGSRDWSKKPKIGCGVVNISIIVVLLALIGASIWAEVQLDKHINDIIDQGQEVEDFFNQYNPDSGLYSEAQQNASLENLESLLLSQTPEPTPELQNVTILEGANVILGGVFGDINELVDPISLDTVLDYVENDLEVFRHWVVIGYLIVVVVVLCVLVSAILCGICIASPVFLIIMVIVLVVLTLTMWVAAGGNLALLVVVGDICNDPDMLVRNLTQDQSDTVNQSIINYYLVCNDTCQPSPFREYVIRAEETFAFINTTEDDLQNYISNNVNRSLLQAPLDEVIQGFNGARTGINDISNCDFIHNIYLDVLQSLCGDAYDAAVTQFGLICGLCLGLMVLVVTATFHTGFYCNNKNEYDEEATAFEFPATSTAGVWQSYGTNVNYNTSYTRYREDGQTRPSGASEPPKYNDLQRPATNSQLPASHYTELQEISDTSSNRPPSGSYDHT